MFHLRYSPQLQCFVSRVRSLVRWQPKPSAEKNSSARWLISLQSRPNPSFHSVKHFLYSLGALSGLTFHLLTVSYAYVT